MMIRRKLIGGYACMVAIRAITGVYSFIINGRIQRDVIELSAHAHAEVHAAHRLHRAVDVVEARLRQLVMAREQESISGRSLSGGPVRAARAALHEALIGMREAVAEGSRPSIARARQTERGAAAEQSELALFNQLHIATAIMRSGMAQAIRAASLENRFARRTHLRRGGRLGCAPQRSAVPSSVDVRASVVARSRRGRQALRSRRRRGVPAHAHRG